ncbi:zinc finger protein 28 homolog [Felis catus]|uniref:zinc finger protein 28 homolog n=1 Tax=Felis catus TaxID=9685 RepID=UPI001D19DF88|nr:zinc finger protein 28 homolog [Felis catus]
MARQVPLWRLRPTGVSQAPSPTHLLPPRTTPPGGLCARRSGLHFPAAPPSDAVSSRPAFLPLIGCCLPAADWLLPSADWLLPSASRASALGGRVGPLVLTPGVGSIQGRGDRLHPGRVELPGCCTKGLIQRRDVGKLPQPGLCRSKPDVISLLEQEKQPWMVTKAMTGGPCPDLQCMCDTKELFPKKSTFDKESFHWYIMERLKNHFDGSNFRGLSEIQQRSEKEYFR